MATETQATASPIVDYEFDRTDPLNPAAQRIAWTSQSAPGSIVGNLWIGGVDTTTGLFSPADGRGLRLDTNCASATAFGNGPEWMLGGLGTTLCYTKYVGSTPGGAAARSARAWQIDGRWVAALLDQANPAIIQLGTQTTGDASPRIHYTSPDSSGYRSGVYWRKLDDPLSERRVPGTSTNNAGTPRRWVAGSPTTHQIIYTANDWGSQTFLYDTDTGSVEQLTFDASVKDDAFMWQAPEYGGEYVFFVAARLSPGPGHVVQIYRKVSGTWTVVNSILSSMPFRTWIWSPEPYVFNGASYVFAMLSAASAALAPNADTAITSAPITATQFFPLTDVTLPKFRSDPEWCLVYNAARGRLSPAIYYNRYVQTSLGGGSEGVWFVPTGI